MRFPPIPVEAAFRKAAAETETLEGFLVQKTPRRFGGQPFMKLLVRRYDPVSGDRLDDEEITQPVVLQLDNYRAREFDVTQVHFHEFLYPTSPSHVNTFLEAIKRTSAVQLRLVAFNQSPLLTEMGWVGHRLLGIVDGRHYLLVDYAGPQNLACPVRVQAVAKDEESQFERFLREHPAPAPAPGQFPEQVFPDGYRRYKAHLQATNTPEE